MAGIHRLLDDQGTWNSTTQYKTAALSDQVILMPTGNEYFEIATPMVLYNGSYYFAIVDMPTVGLTPDNNAAQWASLGVGGGSGYVSSITSANSNLIVTTNGNNVILNVPTTSGNGIFPGAVIYDSISANYNIPSPIPAGIALEPTVAGLTVTLPDLSANPPPLSVGQSFIIFNLSQTNNFDLYYFGNNIIGTLKPFECYEIIINNTNNNQGSVQLVPNLLGIRSASRGILTGIPNIQINDINSLQSEIDAKFNNSGGTINGFATVGYSSNGGTAEFDVQNTDNTNTNSNAKLNIVTSTNGGNPYLSLTKQNTASWSLGLDGNSNECKISNYNGIDPNALFTFKANGNLTVTTDPVNSLDLATKQYVDQNSNTSGFPGGLVIESISSDYNIPTPIPYLLNINPTLNGLKLILPSLNKIPKPLNVGQSFSVFNANSENSLNVCYQDSSTIITVEPYQEYEFIVNDNSTANGNIEIMPNVAGIESKSRGILKGVVNLNPADLNTDPNNQASVLTQIPNNLILSNISGSDALPSGNNISQILDTISSSVGSILYRNEKEWTNLEPGKFGQLLQSNGNNAPSWVDAGSATYEQFKWEPVEPTGTVVFASATGLGFKIGNQVTLYFAVQYGDNPSPTNNAQINGWDPSLNPGSISIATGTVLVVTQKEITSQADPFQVRALSNVLEFYNFSNVVTLGSLSNKTVVGSITYLIT